MLAKGSSLPWVSLRPNFVSNIDYDRDERVLRTSQQRGAAQFQKSFSARQTASRTFAFLSARLLSAQPKRAMAGAQSTSPSGSMIAAARGGTSRLPARCGRVCPACAGIGSRAGGMSRPAKNAALTRRTTATPCSTSRGRGRCGPGPGRWSRNCITPARESSRRRWSSSPFARTWDGRNRRASGELWRQHPGQFVRRGNSRAHHAGVRAG